MRWLIVYLLLVAVIWLFVANTNLRRAILAATTVLFAAFIVLFTVIEKPDAPETATAEQFKQARQKETVRYGAVTAADIAIDKTSLNNASRTIFDSAGREQTVPDLYNWEFETSLTNRSTQYTVDSISVRLSLYSCPQFYDVPQTEVDPGRLSANCTIIGRRSIDLDQLGLKPGQSTTDKRSITFPNQSEPRNPRYWLEVQSATASATD
jgi:hypothetical protein